MKPACQLRRHFIGGVLDQTSDQDTGARAITHMATGTRYEPAGTTEAGERIFKVVSGTKKAK